MFSKIFGIFSKCFGGQLTEYEKEIIDHPFIVYLVEHNLLQKDAAFQITERTRDMIQDETIKDFFGYYYQNGYLRDRLTHQQLANLTTHGVIDSMEEWSNPYRDESKVLSFDGALTLTEQQRRNLDTPTIQIKLDCDPEFTIDQALNLTEPQRAEWAANLKDMHLEDFINSHQQKQNIEALKEQMKNDDPEVCRQIENAQNNSINYLRAIGWALPESGFESQITQSPVTLGQFGKEPEMLQYDAEDGFEKKLPDCYVENLRYAPVRVINDYLSIISNSKLNPPKATYLMSEERRNNLGDNLSAMSITDLMRIDVKQTEQNRELYVDLFDKSFEQNARLLPFKIERFDEQNQQEQRDTMSLT